MNLSATKILKRKEILLALLSVFLGFALRFYTFDQKSLWLDEVYTFNDSRDDFSGQIEFYEKNPTYLHPPLFFYLTHQFYPFARPERDLRIIPLMSGTLSIPLIYLLAKQFSPAIALPCAVSLAFMTYHVSISQDGRPYSLLMFIGMAGIYFFLRHLKTLQKGYLLLVASFFSLSFYISYASIPFIILSQVLWFYRPREEDGKPGLSSFLILNGLVLLFCLPWIIFVLTHLGDRTFTKLFEGSSPGSFGYILFNVLHDWVPHLPLLIISIILLALFPILSGTKRNALILLALFVFPIGGLFLFGKVFQITHFVNSRYFISFLPILLIVLYLSMDGVAARIGRLKQHMRPVLLFTMLFVASNAMILPLYYQSEKQDFKGLVHYLKNHLREDDKIFVVQLVLIPGILHYFGTFPEGRHYEIPFFKDKRTGTDFRMTSIVLGGKGFSLYHGGTCCTQYVDQGNRLWIIAAGKWMASQISQSSPCALMGYFDGSFLNYVRFPTDASIYLFLWDPESPQQEGINAPIE